MVKPRAHGFTYLVLLFMVALLGVSLAAAGVIWELRSRREKEAELLFIGDEVVRAIDAYYDGSPTAAKDYPQRLEDLLEDKRFPIPRRYLRRIYRDPFTGKPDWGLVILNSRLVGVYSLASGTPVKQDGFMGAESGFKGAQSYAGWRFLALNLASSPPVPTPIPVGSGPAPVPPAPAAAAFGAARR